MTIGIIPVHLQQIILGGQPQIRTSQSTIHVRQVGVFLTEVVVVYGQRQDLMILHTIVQIGECLSVYHLLPQRGTLLRVLASTAMAVSAVSVARATIGLRRLAAAMATARTPCGSAAVAASDRRTTTFVRAVTQSVVSKNQNNLASVVRKPRRKQGSLDHAF